MAVHLMSGEVCGFCLHWYVCVLCEPLGCMCVFWGHSCSLLISVPILSVYALGFSVCSTSVLKTFFLPLGCGASPILHVSVWPQVSLTCV